MLENSYKDLAEFIEKNELLKQAFEDLNTAFENWKNDSPEHYMRVFKNKELESLNVFVHEVSLRFSTWPECERQFVVITILIHDDNCYLGDYNRFFPINPNATGDDFLYIL